jgi:hypothetical protein
VGDFLRGVLGVVSGRFIFHRDVTVKVRMFGCWALERVVVHYLLGLGRAWGRPVEVHYYDLDSGVLYVTTPEIMASPRFLQHWNGRAQYVVPLRCWQTAALPYASPVPGEARTLRPRRVLVP